MDAKKATLQGPDLLPAMPFSSLHQGSEHGRAQKPRKARWVDIPNSAKPMQQRMQYDLRNAALGWELA
jgi:hypothetical protein